MTELLYGRNAVRECLRARRRHINRLQLAKGIKPNPVIQEIIELAHQGRIPIETVARRRLDDLAPANQGVALETGRLPLSQPEDMVALAKRQNQPPFLLALDHLEDPHNLGALLRTAEAVGMHGVLLPARRSAGITPAVVNASAGASEHLAVAVVTNLVRSLNSLKEAGVWVVGVEQGPQARPYYQVDLAMPLVLVLGSEGKGLSRLTERSCDLLISLPMQGKIDSLNVSVAGGLAMYEAWRARKFSNNRFDN